MEADKSQDLFPGSWRPRRANGVAPVQIPSGLRPKKSGETQKSRDLLAPTEVPGAGTRNSFCYNGLIHRKYVGMEPAADSKGVLVVTKRRSGQWKPAISYVRTTINKKACARLSSIRHMIDKNKYQPNLRMAAILRASAILHSQKPVMVKRKRTHPTKSS
uniref:60S ribosomal protein L28-like n=1 Tax=Callithrix jacchus TaxID=9483 RepID=UPI0023DD547F|nr:60S ribosomal protein L28-like [Callithrix jacchus]